ncbi:NAD(P)-dependent dehydrogenase, short-chain alcohol dehydrogenase family [Tistlia consotensis]|uniref:NAD(P)-dependent dehydrogenase, short-chain alcohol dehydrogenase family n=1 Tax=Tistlia consotensis USBA 355 TaxID=560819 RepID=A0A1Y6BW74_9PROT|nr:SDR family NAD(P)-dependent oxidoreductase [Tistlia consotensis]SMF32224.1 NAD(P)-dependent dehydrogenase, short-chain alcohol dehydrogenase family [Tistlia consotensis USBA 355]SNR68259.1 NAD(P)-dependent dehydrogenase, short-chain alcohol dehydrogenase family [Tistlia consotensis]
MRLAGRRILISGAASGIGRATAEVFHREGAALALLDRDAGRLAETAEALSGGEGPAVAWAVAEIADEAAVGAAVAETAAALGGLDGVVSSAGIDLLKPFGEVSAAEWRQVLEVNLTGPFNLCSAALPFLRAAGGGSIVQVASGAALRPLAGRTAYCASKAGLVMFAKALAVDLADDGIRVNAICPGIIDTPLFRQSFERAPDPEAELERILDRYLIRRVGRPEDIAYAALYLSSAESAHVTGTTLAVDGGRSFH